jgi:hypothetical protein
LNGAIVPALKVAWKVTEPEEALTLTVTLGAVTVPPEPVQLSPYVEVADGATVLVPDVGWVPLQAPDAEHDDAFDELQVKVAVWPVVIEVGLALKLTVGKPLGGV